MRRFTEALSVPEHEWHPTERLRELADGRVETQTRQSGSEDPPRPPASRA